MGNRHLRRETKPRPNGKGKAARRSRAISATSATAVPAATRKTPEVQVTPEERGKLAEDLVYFNISIYREASPGELRKDDIERAEKDIIAVTGRSQ